MKWTLWKDGDVELASFDTLRETMEHADAHFRCVTQNVGARLEWRTDNETTEQHVLEARNYSIVAEPEETVEQKIIREVADELNGVNENNSDGIATIRTDYRWSGANAECWGIDVPSGFACRAIEEAAKRGLTGARIDPMGTGKLVYWKAVRS